MTDKQPSTQAELPTHSSQTFDSVQHQYWLIHCSTEPTCPISSGFTVTGRLLLPSPAACAAKMVLFMQLHLSTSCPPDYFAEHTPLPTCFCFFGNLGRNWCSSVHAKWQNFTHTKKRWLFWLPMNNGTSYHGFRWAPLANYRVANTRTIVLAANCLCVELNNTHPISCIHGHKSSKDDYCKCSYYTMLVRP